MWFQKCLYRATKQHLLSDCTVELLYVCFPATAPSEPTAFSAFTVGHCLLGKDRRNNYLDSWTFRKELLTFYCVFYLHTKLENWQLIHRTQSCYFLSSSLTSLHIFSSIFEVSYSRSISNSSQGFFHFCASFIFFSGSSNLIPFMLYFGLSHRFDHGLGFILTCSWGERLKK